MGAALRSPAAPPLLRRRVSHRDRGVTAYPRTPTAGRVGFLADSVLGLRRPEPLEVVAEALGHGLKPESRVEGMGVMAVIERHQLHHVAARLGGGGKDLVEQRAAYASPP